MTSEQRKSTFANTVDKFDNKSVGAQNTVAREASTKKASPLCPFDHVTKEYNDMFTSEDGMFNRLFPDFRITPGEEPDTPSYNLLHVNPLLTVEATTNTLPTDTLVKQAHTKILKNLKSVSRLAELIRKQCPPPATQTEEDTKKGRGRVALRNLADSLRSGRLRFVSFDAEHSLVTKGSNAVPLEFGFHEVGLEDDDSTSSSLASYHTFVHPGDLEYKSVSTVKIPVATNSAVSEFNSLQCSAGSHKVSCYPFHSAVQNAPSLLSSKASQSPNNSKSSMMAFLGSELSNEAAEFHLSTCLKLSCCKVPGSHAIPLKEATFLNKDYFKIVEEIKCNIGFSLPNDGTTSPLSTPDGKPLVILINEGGAVSDIHALRWLFAASNAVQHTQFDLSLDSLMNLPIFDLAAVEGLVREALTAAGMWEEGLLPKRKRIKNNLAECCFYHSTIRSETQRCLDALEENSEDAKHAWGTVIDTFYQMKTYPPHCALLDSFELKEATKQIFRAVLDQPQLRNT